MAVGSMAFTSASSRNNIFQELFETGSKINLKRVGRLSRSFSALVFVIPAFLSLPIANSEITLSIRQQIFES